MYFWNTWKNNNHFYDFSLFCIKKTVSLKILYFSEGYFVGKTLNIPICLSTLIIDSFIFSSLTRWKNWNISKIEDCLESSFAHSWQTFLVFSQIQNLTWQRQTMSTKKPSDKRYFPTAIEQFILIQNMDKYFSFPERSPERTKVAEDVASLLRTISGHWSYRSVRLWFNNNRKSNFCHNTDICKQNVYLDFKPAVPFAAPTFIPQLPPRSHDSSSDSDHPSPRIPPISSMDALLSKREITFPDQLYQFRPIVGGTLWFDLLNQLQPSTIQILSDHFRFFSFFLLFSIIICILWFVLNITFIGFRKRENKNLSLK